MANGGTRFSSILRLVGVIGVAGILGTAIAPTSATQIISLATLIAVSLLAMARTESLSAKTDELARQNEELAQQNAKTRHDLKNDLNAVGLKVQHADQNAEKTAQAVGEKKLGITLGPTELDAVAKLAAKYMYEAMERERKKNVPPSSE